jgi:hypothetical protein
MLYLKLLPSGAVTTIVPVGIGHVGCIVTLAVGVAGATGAGFTVRGVPELIQTVAIFLTVTE